jgi:hypothetical protein
MDKLRMDTKKIKDEKNPNKYISKIRRIIENFFARNPDIVNVIVKNQELYKGKIFQTTHNRTNNLSAKIIEEDHNNNINNKVSVIEETRQAGQIIIKNSFIIEVFKKR